MAMKFERPLLVIAAVVAAVCVAYLPAFVSGFVWDDDLHLINNVVLKENGLYRVWVLREEWIYYPVTFTSYWLEHKLWGLDPSGYHVVNVAIHAISALLVWRILGLLRLDSRVALFASLLFALHPQNVESVAWIAQRKNTLSMLFFLCSIHGYLRYDASGDGSRSPARWSWYAWSLFAFTLGMLSKETIAPLPLVLLLLLAWRRGWGEPRRQESALGQQDGEPWRRPVRTRDLTRIAPFLLVALVVVLHDLLQQKGFIGEDVVRGDSLLAKIVGAGWNAWFYAWKTMAPMKLSFVYPRWTIDPGQAVAWIPTTSALVILLASVLVWRRGGRWAGAGRALAFTLVYYALMISPALGFVNFYFLRYSYVADHYQYYAQLGIVTLAAVAVARISRIESRPAVFWIAAGALLAVLGALTNRQCLAYRDEETLWRDTLAKNPAASLALNNLGRLVGQRGDHTEAFSLFRRATEVDPTNREAWRNAALAAEMAGQPERALGYFREALRHWPGQAGLSAQEIDGLSLDEAHARLGLLLARLNQIAAAAYHYGQAARLNPDNVEARVGIGDMLLVSGQTRGAIAAYQEARRLAPEAPEPLEMLTWIYASHPAPSVRSAHLAVELGEQAVALTQRRDASTLDALAAAYAEAARFDVAIETAAEAEAVARRSDQPELAARISARRGRYERGEPYRMEKFQLR